MTEKLLTKASGKVSKQSKVSVAEHILLESQQHYVTLF